MIKHYCLLRSYTALIKESISGEKENGGPCVLAVMIKAFLEALADMAQFESNDVSTLWYICEEVTP